MKGLLIAAATAALVVGAVYVLNETNAPQGTPPGGPVGEVPLATPLPTKTGSLRDELLHETAQQARVTPVRGVWGVLMERGYAKGTATTVALADGTASMILSTGGSVPGGKSYPPAHAAAVKLCEQAADAMGATTTTHDFPAPAKGRVRFYVLTTDGVRTAETDIVLTAADAGPGTHIGSRDRELASMMDAGEAVVSALREATERGLLR